MINMKSMIHNLRNLCLTALAVATAASCVKTAEEGPNVAGKRYLDAWRAIHYPTAVEKDGIYIIDEKPGTGQEWTESLPVTFLTYTIRNLDGTVSSNADEDMARQLGTWKQTLYYGPQVVMTGESYSYAGLDALLKGMRQGGTRTAIIPSWLMTYKRYDAQEEYLDYETENSDAIYTVTFLEQTNDLAEYEYRSLQRYAHEQWNVQDTLTTGAVFFKSFTEFESEPQELPADTTVYINYTGRRVYDGQVFDTTVADTAKLYNIYNPSKTYAPVSISWSENPTGILLNGSTKLVNGFNYGIHAMHAGEKASFAFGYRLGYSSSGNGELIPAYTALQFDIEMVPKP